MTDKVWKQMERRIATAFNGKRNPYSGSVDLISGADVIENTILPGFYIECKLRGHFHHHTLFNVINAKAMKENKKPLLVTHEKFQHDDLVTIRMADLLGLIQ